MFVATNGFFIFLAWLAYPETFDVLVGLMIFFSLSIMALSIWMSTRKQKRIERAFRVFLAEPNETNEEKLRLISPKTHWSSIDHLGNVIRMYRSEINDQYVELADYENYIEGWVHDIKKPLSLMTLVLDNRTDEMSSLVRQRMVHVRDQMVGDVEQILFFARLGTTHKDYFFERIPIVDFCKEIIEKQQSLVEESAFQITFKGKNFDVLSDRKGLSFIIEQIIINSTKYVTSYQEKPMLTFTVDDDAIEHQTFLHIQDNGPGVSSEDLPFIFDKGFTGGRGTYTREATGMGLFLVSKMADDLAIQVDATSTLNAGLTISLSFPRVH